MVNAQNVQPNKPEGIEFPGDVRHVAFAGDWHGSHHFAERVIESLPERVDVIVHVGDFGYSFDGKFLNSVNKFARKAGIVVMFVDGNHENHEWLNAQPVDDDGVRRLKPRVWHLPRGFRWEWYGLTFLAMGGAHSVDSQSRTPGVSWWPEETISIKDAYEAIDAGDADVVISHDTVDGYWVPGMAPEGVFPSHEIEMAERHRELLGEIVRGVNARYIWHGHYHAKYRLEIRGVKITGLDCNRLHDDAVEGNIDIVDLEELV